MRRLQLKGFVYGRGPASHEAGYAGNGRLGVARLVKGGTGFDASGRSPRVAAFSLLEVIAAVAIFAIGMIAVLGMYAPVTKSVAAVSDAEAAARVADAVRSRLRTVPFEAALALVQEVADVRRKDGDGSYNPNDGTRYPAVMFGKLDGEVGIYNPAQSRRRWEDSRNAVVADADKFFEIDLIRNDAVTPKTGDATAAMVAFIIRVRWPAFIQTSPTAAVQSAQNPGGGAVTFDHGRKQVLFFTGAISR
jgi:type II secretory pathway pseudopilin PulG